ncbi:bifunctional 4-hydroxy-2-oxoglutarate aldolase/2-dehydro-3-deoxy-phosphogluconate aldolase [Lactiplantibacillus mudanjiangensis]|uniref:Bifunctional 2-keto-4-hydroxyglutarate aldolase/2-keto-3-deoxy-6-phosphogluconate aldolase [Lactobacillus pentosus] n=1 Tax=Lactiplantibacillus mudanjiangensis TaxID=1296538 RepID=A0A660E246_9LACO|nr:bifunctional 4-hydroxy-2-oxoglutarate aldolase/2-dehydro-3-deoxy-phosphogluconate aldolase [Lactiplantibacillus mudanjiangensis]VDG22581.1 bifunctional 2-keto-4-hydroxyglutarate aldolase/2-keto-3-deoxy-6-phosphogluconate aldolase [Lactobacillus pentosus] [Lactiplantibacillus mudanjiangensis]VDG26882.1 bifunctional 2-keto-4-hydroxyglutarate aldolase/2-keto-3-deoxy-6-phosphogluconate aldolase [Lactobacillus pentosus] [Lactiplantibacillus mudanjiangensis]
MQKVKILQNIEAAGVIAVVRGNSPEQAFKTSEAAINGGVKGIELTFTVPHADQVIAKLTEQFGDTDAVIGAGTVLDTTTARLAIMAGAQFIVSPTFDPDVAQLCNLYEIPYIPGCMSVTEMQTAMKFGSSLVKMFPGNTLTPKMIGNVKAPFPQISIMPSGGVSLDNLDEWFAAGATVVGAGGNLVGPGDKGDFDTVTENAKKYMAEFNRIKGN